MLVPSRLDLVDEVCQIVSDFFLTLDFTEDDIYAFDLSLREGVINAMKHGNRWDDALTVSVLVEVAGNDCLIRVRDSGKYSASIPQASGELLAPNGRGLVIMRSIMDSVEFNRRSYGFELVLRKRVSLREREETAELAVE